MDDPQPECAICLEPPRQPEKLPCGHTFCRGCIVQLRHSRKDNTTCPLCRAPLPPPACGDTTTVTATAATTTATAATTATTASGSAARPSRAAAAPRRAGRSGEARRARLQVSAAHQEQARLLGAQAARIALLEESAAAHRAIAPQRAGALVAPRLAGRQRQQQQQQQEQQQQEQQQGLQQGQQLLAHRRSHRSAQQQRALEQRRPWRGIADEQRAEAERERQLRGERSRAHHRRRRMAGAHETSLRGRGLAQLAELVLEAEASGHRTGGCARAVRPGRAETHAELLQRFDDVAQARADGVAWSGGRARSGSVLMGPADSVSQGVFQFEHIF